MPVSRRHFLTFAAASAAFAGLSRAVAGGGNRSQVIGYGELQPDPAGVFDLPRGFAYRIVSEFGQPMDDGFLTPGKFDGMGCFAAGPGRVALVRNHELQPADLSRSAFGAEGRLAARIAPDRVYDRVDGVPMAGGATTLVWDLAHQTLLGQHLSLAGTMLNCAGGVTPRGTWLSCEETTVRAGARGALDHGWVFEVPADLRGLAAPLPIKNMGRFRHEAAVTDPRTGIVYLTEDMADGLLYRYLPHEPDRLLAGGRLQALGVRDAGRDLRNSPQPSWRQGEWLETAWIDLDGVESPDDDLRLRGAAKGAAPLARGEGLFFGRGELFIACTIGGPARRGQLLRYVPSRFEGQPGEAAEPGRLQLFVEPGDGATLDMADNLAVSPWGHLFVCEDKGRGRNQLKGVTPAGEVYAFGRNAAAPALPMPVNCELAGACFSPDGSTLFVNLHLPGKTLAITGPWASFKA